jgi:coenzyme F420-reducing hydrogenase gamma subunit
MWRGFCVGVLIALGACASASRIDRSAANHEARAKQLAKDGNWEAASKERQKAAKQAEKANSRRGFEDAMPVVFK